MQPDTLIPDLTNPQNLNRYSYVRNRPAKFTDPSGHTVDCAPYDSACKNAKPLSPETILKKFDVTVGSGFSEKQKWDVVFAVVRIGSRFARERNKNETAAEAFTAEYNPVEIVQGCTHNCHNEPACGNQMSGTVIYQGNEVNCTPGGAYSGFPGEQIEIASLASEAVGNLVHEFGHVYDHQHGDQPRKSLATTSLVADRSLFLRPNPCNGCFLWQFNTTGNEGETFGDMFVAWIYDAWNTDPTNANKVRDAQTWMNQWMPHP